MAYFFRKKIKNKYYLFKGENVFENGRSVRKKSKYIGPFEELCEYFQQAEILIQDQQHFEYGLSRAVYDLAKQLGFIQIFNNHLKKRIKDQYLSKRILMMIINRIVSPCAKYSIQKWYSKSDLSNTLDISPDELSSQKIYRSMDILDNSSAVIEIALCKIISAQENISCRTLYLDFTNQETYCRNHDSDILKNGLNKRGHNNLLQINLSLCCDADSGIPFFHKIYPGNWNDKQFIKSYAIELRNKLDSIGYQGRNLLIVDRGINGKDNFNLLFDNKFDYIGGLTEQFFPDFFNIKKSVLRNSYSHKRQKKNSLEIAYTCQEAEIYDRKHKVVILYSGENHKDHIEKLTSQLMIYMQYCENKLSSFKNEIADKTFQSRWNNVEKIKNVLKKKNKKLYSLLILNIKSYRFNLTWDIKENNKKIKEQLANAGKYVLFTNKLNLTPRKILQLYLDKDKIEKNFQFLKANAYTNRKIVLGPMLHSKDKRIESHVYTCIIALQLYQIIRNRLSKTNINLTTQQVFDELEEIHCYYTKIAGKKEKTRHINSLTELQNKLLKSLNLEIFN